jgi:hypothetical protein
VWRRFISGDQRHEVASVRGDELLSRPYLPTDERISYVEFSIVIHP